MSNGDSFDLAAYKHELHSSLYVAVYSSKAHYNAQRLYSRRHFWIGLLATAIPLVVGSAAVKALTTSQFAATISYIVLVLSVAAAVLSGLQTFFQDADRAGHHRTTGAGYGAIRRRIQQALALLASTKDEANKALDSINKSLEDVGTNAPTLSNRILAQAKIEAKEELHL